jgi:diguanylate cyclase (GGDEF)-like protein
LHRLLTWLFGSNTQGRGADNKALSADQPPAKNRSHLGEARLADLLANTTEIVSLYDRGYRLTHYSAKFKNLRGNAVTAGAAISEIYPSFRNDGHRDEFQRSLQGGFPAHVDLRSSPNEAPCSALIFSVADGVGILETAETPRGGRSAAEEQERVILLHQAAHDMLTGLQNRRRFSEDLQRALSTVDRSKDKIALLQIDLDDFKSVNDTLGHGTGDTLLQLAAGRIQGALGVDESAYRYAGDEFAVIQSGKKQPEEAERLAGSLVEAFKPPFIINGIPLFVGSSIGVAFGPEHGTESEQLMKAADIALYAAKRDGRGCARTFNRSMLLLLEQRENLRRSLRMALERNELFLEYQPLVRPPSEVVGFEALLRWRHPEVGLIPPSVFIPIAEADGLMDEIGRWVLEQACRQALKWPSSVTVTVNLSPAQFLSGSITDTVAQVIDSVGIRPERLELEITETVLLEKTIDNLDTLNTLNVLGIRISLDDFGTYYSSLSYLKTFPFDRLKIDRYFIADLETDAKSQTIVRSIIGLARGLGISIIAEGVETAGQARWLLNEDCDCLQGNFLGRPLGAEATREFIARSSKDLLHTKEARYRAV